jgi:hypothetical protein
MGGLLGLVMDRTVLGAGPAPDDAGQHISARPAFEDEAVQAERGSGGAAPRDPHPHRPAAIDCLVTHHAHLPRDRMGHRLSTSGRTLIIEAVAKLYGLEITARDLTRDAHKRWRIPAHGLTVSVAHCDSHSAVALTTGPVNVGVDLQDERDRPAAMQWLGTLLGRQKPAVIRDFTECEALIKASHVTKETFAGVRLPPWRPGWRPTNVPSYWVRSQTVAPAMHLALAADAPAPVRMNTPILEPA